MARYDMTDTFLDVESDDISLETTVPTDFSLSADDSELPASADRRRRVNKHALDRKQLLHDLQVLKIELSQKSLIIDNLKAEHMQKNEDLEEKLSDALHQKQILQARLESQLKIQQDDSRRRQEQIQKELDVILKRQHQLEATNERLQEKAGDIRHNLVDLDLTEKQYSELRQRNVEELPLRDFVAIKLHEAVRPLRIENEEFREKYRTSSEELHRCRTQLESLKDMYTEEQRNHTNLQVQHQKISLLYADTKTKVQHGDYKVENYDKVKSERDNLEEELLDLKKQHGYLVSSHQALTSQRDEFSNEVSAAKQTITLLKQDKDFFAKQVSDIGNKLLYGEERVAQLNEQLDRAKQSREELYEKYVASRDQYKGEYEMRLREELEGIRVRTNTEIDRLKTSTKEMFERENRNLREARDMALSERDRALSTEKEATNKYDQLLNEFRALQVQNDGKVSEIHNEARLKAFEAERTSMVYEETVRTLKEVQVENEKLNKKLEVLTKEYYQMQNQLERRISELEATNSEKVIKLQTYEKLEQELDDVVMQAAEGEDEGESERVLFSYGYGANVPTTSKRRLKQSVHLARRVLNLERTNATQLKDIESLKQRNKELTEEVQKANQLLDQSQQPYHYLVESIRTRDAQINKQKEHIIILEEDMRALEKSKSNLTKSKNQMALDLERLLHQKEEMSVMKEVVKTLSERRHISESVQPVKQPAARTTPRSPRGKLTGTGPKKTRPIQLPGQTFEPREFDENIHKPEPTQFTKGRKYQAADKNRLVTIKGK